GYLEEIAASIAVALCAVQRLMKVAHEMHDKEQSLFARVACGVVVFDYLEKRLDAVNDAVAVLAVSVRVETRGIERDIDEVPLRILGILLAVRRTAPDEVGPVRNAVIGDRSVPNQRADGGAGIGL